LEGRTYFKDSAVEGLVFMFSKYTRPTIPENKKASVTQQPPISFIDLETTATPRSILEADFPRLAPLPINGGYLRALHPDLGGTVFHSTRKWFITQCERTGVPEHFTASLVGHQSARSENKLTYGLYSAGISDTQKRDIFDQVRLPQGVVL
jgi:hypothetical protein